MMNNTGFCKNTHDAVQYADALGRESEYETALELKAEQIAAELDAGGQVWDGQKWYDQNDVLALMVEAGHSERFADQYKNACTDIQRQLISKQYIEQMAITRAELASEIAEDVLAAENAAAEDL